MNEFNRKFNSILSQVSDEVERTKIFGSDTNFKEKLQIAINAWGHELTPDWDDIYREWKTTEQPSSNILQESFIQISNKIIPDYFVEPLLTRTIPIALNISEMLGIANILNKLNIKNEIMEITLLIGFLIASGIYGFSVINNPRQRERNNRRLDYDSHSSQFLIGRDLTPPPDHQREYTQPNLEYSLVLVIYAAQKNLADSIRRKGRIDIEDSEILYRATQYLSKSNKSVEDIKNQMSRFHVSEESEYDVYLLAIKLREDDPRFNKGVNQLDRVDAFRELPDLALSVEVSERLKMEAYADFDIYVR